MKSLKNAACITISLTLALASQATAADTLVPNPALVTLTKATVAELPAKAAELVAQASAKNLKQATVDAVKAAVGLNPAAAPAIVGSVAQSKPAAASIAAATAAALVPNQAANIARAAAAAAPDQAGAIVEAVCRVLPSAYQEIATAVAETVPSAGKQILAGLAAALPQLKGLIDQSVASFEGKNFTVSAVLSQVARSEGSAGIAALTTTAPALASRVAVGAPVVTPSTTPLVQPPSGGQTPPRGGRGYSAP